MKKEIFVSQAGPYHLVPENEEEAQKDSNQDVNNFEDLVQPGIILAVYKDDPGEDYYLVKSLSHVQTVTTTSGNDWGNQYLTGTKVVEGLYFDKIKGSKFDYKIIKGRKVMIPLLSIRFICIGGETRCGKFVLNEELHREILAACDEMK